MQSAKGSCREELTFGISESTESEKNASDWVEPTLGDTIPVTRKLFRSHDDISHSEVNNLELLTNFPCKLEVRSICSVSPEQAYVGGKSPLGPDNAQAQKESRASCLCLMDACGKEKYVDRIETDFEIEDFVTAEDGKVIITDSQGEKIVKMTVYCTKEMVISTHPYQPMGICHLSDGNWIIGMCLPEEPKGKLVKYSQHGRIIQETTGGEQKGISCLMSPYRLTEAHSGDVYLTDSKQKAVIALDSGGIFMWKYGSLQRDQSRFEPTDICIDGKGRIVVLDKASESILILNRNGGLNGEIMLRNFQCNVQRPHCFTIDRNNKLWLGSLRQVTIFQLR